MKKLIAISILISALTCACFKTSSEVIVPQNTEQQVQEEVSNVHSIDNALSLMSADFIPTVEFRNIVPCFSMIILTASNSESL